MIKPETVTWVKQLKQILSINTFLQIKHDQNGPSSIITTSSIQKLRVLANEEVSSKNLFPQAMYAHLCHPEVECPEDGAKRILQYYPQPHQFHASNPRLSSSPATSKTPFTLTSSLFPTTQFYSGHMGNLHEGY